MSVQISSKRFGILGALFAVVLTFPMAALCALIYRFPIPFAGYESGISAVPRAMGATLFYGMLGGFVVVAVLGYIAGLTASTIDNQGSKKTLRLTLFRSALIALACVMLLAILDKLIGPW